MQWQNRIYENRFLVSLRKKIKMKYEKHPQDFDLKLLKQTKTIWEFDHNFTAPIHGFKSAQDYYTQSSSKQFLKNINLPTLILTALDDPFLDFHCFPYEEAKANEYLFFLGTENGGHVGFASFKEEFYWSDLTILQFLKQECIS